MANLINLTKINFGNQFRTSSDSSILSLLKTLLFISLYCILGLFIYRFANYMVTTFNKLGMPELALSEFFAFGSVFILALSIFRMDIFNSKDHDLLASLPISKKIIVASKLINVYIFNLLIIAIIMVPAYIAYINVASYSPNFLLLALISILTIPIIPTIIAVFLNSIITIISTHFKYKKIIQTILMLILMVFSLYFAYEMNSNLELNLFNISESFNNFFNSFYPLTKYFTSMIVDNNMHSMLIFIGISILSIIVLTIFLSIFYNKVTNKIAVRTHHNINYKHISNHSYFTNLVKKDIKRVLCSPNFLLNSCIGLILLILIPIILFFVNINDIENIALTEDTLIKYLPIIFAFFILLSSTTSSLISLEGKSIYILKMLPIKFSKIWQSKVLSNYIIILIASFISLVIFNFSLNLTLKTNIEIIMIILSSGLFISLYGLVINLVFPNFSWKSEIKVIKQSASSFITVITGLLIGLFIVYKCNTFPNNYIFLLFISFIIVSFILVLFLQIVGFKIFEKLNT